MKTLEQFLSDYLGKSKGYPDDSQYKGQCLSIVKIYIKECFGINPPPSGTNSAYGYWSKFPNPLGEVFEKVDSQGITPKKGWIAIWQPWPENAYGHIAIVADGCTKTILKNYAQNWTSKIFQLESNKYTNVIGYLVPKGAIIEENNMTQEETNILNFIRGGITINGVKRDITEGDVRRGIGYITDNIDDKVLKLENKVKTLTQQVKDLMDSSLVDGKDVSYWHSSLDSANAELQNYKIKSLQVSFIFTIISKNWDKILKSIKNLLKK